MNVKKLIEELQKQDPDRVVICQKDSEGNGYSPIGKMWTGAYREETSWYGHAGLEELTDLDYKRGFCEADVVLDGVPALFLVPTN